MKQNKIMTIVGWALTTLLTAGLLFSASMKFTQPAEFWKAWVDMFGYPKGLAIPIGIVEVTCAAIFLIPQTRVLGAVLLTGYLGGATATHVRVNDPFYGPVIGGVLVWLALYFRDPRIRALLPITSSAPVDSTK
jgi:DoxX-like family